MALIVTEYLASATEELRRSALAVPEEMVSRTMGEGGWSPLGIVEHVVTTETLFLRRVTTQRQPATISPDEQRQQDLIESVVSVAGGPISAPGITHPANRYGTMAEALEALTRSRQRLAAHVEEDSAVLDTMQTMHPLIGPLSLREAYLIIGAHGVRHARQIDRLLASV